MKFKRHMMYLGALVALIILIVIVDRSEDWLTHVEYPFDVWRMDLDDVLANVGLFLAGLSAFIVAIRRADRAHKKADQVGDRINGGMADMAKEHVAMATQESQDYNELLLRVTSVENQRDDCLKELHMLRSWTNERLDKLREEYDRDKGS